MRLRVRCSIFALFILQSVCLFSQQIKFNKVIDGSLSGIVAINGIAQDKAGFLWISSFSGLYRYDGSTIKHYLYKSGKDSVSKNKLTSITIDRTGIAWLGTETSGILKFDPVTNTFSSLQHDVKNFFGLGSDSITCSMEDHLGNLWIGTVAGVDKFDKPTGKFIHFKNQTDNVSSLSSNYVQTIYEDKQGIIWVGCAHASDDGNKGEGGLNRLETSTGKFTRYLHSLNDNYSLVSDFVTSIFEDSKENLWIGTAGNGLHIMDRETGKFTRYVYDDTHPEKLSAPKPSPFKWNVLSFINEDKAGGIWIGSYVAGINRYEPLSKKVSHFGNIVLRIAPIYVTEDTISGFNEPLFSGAIISFNSKDGSLWIGTYGGNLYKIVQPRQNIPYYNMEAGANSFYEENDSIVWIGTSIKGLTKRNIGNGKDTWFTDKNGDPDIPPDHDILGLRADSLSNLWIATYTGLYKMNLKNNLFTRFRHDRNDKRSIATDTIACLSIDKQNLWIGTYQFGLDKMNLADGTLTHYIHNSDDSNSIANDIINCISKDKNEKIWIGTSAGLDRLDQHGNKFYHYLKQSEILSLCVDEAGTTWAGTTDGLYYLDTRKNVFERYIYQNSSINPKNILHILEDNLHNLWLTTNDAILKIDRQNNAENIYGKNYGIHYNNYYTCDNIKLKNGQLLFGDQNGYYLVSPAVNDSDKKVYLNLTGFKIGDKEIEFTKTGELKTPLWLAKEIRLNYKQTIFSFNFSAIDYSTTEELKYFFKLENYDNTWHDASADRKAYFFNVAPGNYIFHAKAINADGIWSEKTIEVIISPPWWNTWWAYVLFSILFIGALWGLIAWRSRNLSRANKLLEMKVTQRTDELRKEKEKVESTLTELKSTQSQLIQSEKMASLGQLTAGIAHEIQNPLNFVNNFSDVNKEMLEELKAEHLKPKAERDKQTAIEIINDVIANEEKINHHGKRADAIVKGMLQHSRTSTGIKEPTDINALADEYLRLAYHGMRGKDKLFNATMQTDFDSTIGKINIAPQDIGRVLLNLYNNAFYAINEKRKVKNEKYEPTVAIGTKKVNDKIEIKVVDNGNGVPQNIIDKIFQPFFTTKPTGQGTGLGLSLAYDIIKAHGGEIKVVSKTGEGSGFVIELPIA